MASFQFVSLLVLVAAILAGVFYKVSTNEVEQQTGRYGQAFAEHEKKFIGEIHKVNQWRAALREVTGIVGKVYIDGWSEAEFIKEIVKIIQNEPIYKAHVVIKERKDIFWAVTRYFNLIINFISICFSFVLYKTYHEQNRSTTTAYAFVATGGSDSGNFSSDLHTTLIKSRIPAYIHPTRNNTGNRRSIIEKVLRDSKMSIVVFSKDYASSSLCLDELVMIMERKRNDKMGYMVIPIFKDVKQDEVQQQTGAYLNAFASHERKFNQKTVVEWREALEEAVKAANDLEVQSIVRILRPSIEDIGDIVEMIQRYREKQ